MSLTCVNFGRRLLARGEVRSLFDLLAVYLLHFGTEGLEVEGALKRLPPFSFLQHIELFDILNESADYTYEP